MLRIWLYSLGFIGLLLTLSPGPARADIGAISGDDIVLGNASAPITIIEYGALGCPHCAEFETTTFPQLKQNWIDTGKAKYVFRDFPINPPSFRASLLLRCAPRAQYYPFIEQIYADQSTWEADDEYTVNLPALKLLGALGGVSGTRFDACQADKALQNQVAASVQAGQSAGIESTPTILINGNVLGGGAVSYDVLNRALLAASKSP